VAPRRSDGAFDPGTRAILEELRDLRVEMRADRRAAEADRRAAEADRRAAEADRRRADVRFRRFLRDFRADSVRRDAAVQRTLAGVQQAFKDVRTVGLSIVKTLNHHTRILERIDRKLGAPRHNGPRP
jgi:regulator of protease activity HflC (stomatin/prohibitin superfamily)